MKDDFEIVGDDAREARIVAVVLGEASDFEREEVARLCEENPELQVFRRRIEAVHGLIGESRVQNPQSRPNTWKLSKGRREVILEKLGEKETVVAGPKKKGPFLNPAIWQIAGCAAVVVILAGLVVPTQMRSLGLSKEEATSYRAVEDSVRENASSFPSSLVEAEPAVSAPPIPSAPVPKPVRALAAVVPEEAVNLGLTNDFDDGLGVDTQVTRPSSMEKEVALGRGRLVGSSDELLAGKASPASEWQSKAESLSEGVVTAGNRSSDFAISNNSIDGILNNPDRTREAGDLLDLSSFGAYVVPEKNEAQISTRPEVRYSIDQDSSPEFQNGLAGSERSTVFGFQAQMPRAGEGKDAAVDPFGDAAPAPLSLTGAFSANKETEAFGVAGAIVEGQSKERPLVTQSFKVPPTFASDLAGSGGGGGQDDAFADPFASDESMPGLQARRSVKSLLEDSGITFPEGSAVNFDSAKGELVVRNTAENLDVVDQMTDSLASGEPKSIVVDTKFVDVRQNNTEELSFDWAGGSFGGGGARGQERASFDANGGIGKENWGRNEPQSFFFATEYEPPELPNKVSSPESEHYFPAVGGRVAGRSGSEQHWDFAERDESGVDGWLLGEQRNGRATALEDDILPPLDNVVNGGVKADFSNRVEMLGELDEQWEERELGSRSSDLRASLERQQAKVEILEQTKKALKGQSQQAELVELATEMNDYREATREYESSLALLQQLKLKHSSERVGLRAPNEPVQIHEAAKVPKKRGGFLGLGDYKSEAVVQLNANRGFGSNLGVLESREYFGRNFEVIKSSKTLSEAADELDLAERWGVTDEEAIARLKKKVEVQQVTGTDLMKIEAKSKNATEAKEIADAVTKAYQKRRSEEEARRSEAQLEALDSEIEDQKDKVEAKRKVLDTIVRITGRPYFEGSKNSPESMESQLTMMAERNAFEMKKNRDQYRIYLDKLEVLEADQLLRYAAELPVDNNSVRSLHAEYLQATREKEAMRGEGFADAHPKVKVLAERIEGLKKDSEQAVATLKQSLRTNYEMISEQLLVMEDTAPTEESKRELDERLQKERAELKALKKKLAAEKAAKEAERRAREIQALDEKDAETQGDSTFSLHVSDVSFKLAKAALEQGKWPETVRVEEFVNAFSYGERSLGPNEKVGVAMEQAAHPSLSQRNLLRVSLQTAATGRGAGVPLRLTVVLDKSGSMERVDRAAAVDEAFRVLVNQLNPGDRVTLVGFSRTPSLLADHVDGAEGKRLLKILRETPSEGGTNVEEALKLAQSKAMEHYQDGAQNRVILLTDGIANLGESVPEHLMNLVEGMREEGVAFDACGVGVEGLNDDILEALTRKGDGRYYLLGSTEESGADFAKQVAGALRPAAQNVKVQVEWNPERVGKWRLYGFEKHELKKEDFRNDAVDAAEMAAEEEGVALYHVEVKPDGEGPLGVARVRFLDVASNEMVEREWEIAYKGEAAPLRDADAKVRLAGVAGLTAEKLARSAVGERVKWDDLLETTRQLKTVFPKEKRIKDLETMIEQAKGLE